VARERPELEAILEEAMIVRAEGWLTSVDLNVRYPRSRTVAAAPAHHLDLPGDSLWPPLTWAQREALRISAEHQEVRRRDLMARCGISREVARRALASLVQHGLLRRVGRGRGARYVSPASPGTEPR